MKRKVLAIALIILAAVVFACGCTGTTTTRQGEVQDIAVGVLLPLSGDFSEAGESSRVAIEVAAEDINDYYASIGSDRRIRLHIEDTATDPAVALEKLKAFDAQGIRFVIGPGSSTELEAIRTYADESGIIIVSTMSSAPTRAIEGGNDLRFVPPGNYQADAMASLFEYDGIEALVPVWRGDIWGDELCNLTRATFEESGGTVLDGTRYTPGSEDYAGMAAELDAQVGRAISAHGKDKVGVNAIGFNEIVPIMEAAAGTKNLTQVRWYGCDGNVLLGTLVTPGAAARFAAQTNFTGPTYGDGRYTNLDESVYAEIQGRLGRQPDGYSELSYDALWIIAIIRSQTASTDTADLKAALMGVSGWKAGSGGLPLHLDRAGDSSNADYVFWSVKADGDTYQWTPVLRYSKWTTHGRESIGPM
jgi:branched-chain amino acid transport system substrate-binding protein